MEENSALKLNNNSYNELKNIKCDAYCQTNDQDQHKKSRSTKRESKNYKLSHELYNQLAKSIFENGIINCKSQKCSMIVTM